MTCKSICHCSEMAIDDKDKRQWDVSPQSSSGAGLAGGAVKNRGARDRGPEAQCEAGESEDVLAAHEYAE